MEVSDTPGAVPALVTEPRFAQRLREYLEAEQVLDARYRLQRMPEGSVALPVLGDKLTEQHMRALQRAQPHARSPLPQDPVPSKAAAVRTPAQRLSRELHGRPWSTSILHIEAVKSYAPHVHHVVLDLECAGLCPRVGSL
uniref:TYW2 N-terminal domain-containing protein n=1 Tax=Nothoprocta perdicaria TaxID=30464 RepID=A0A8C6Z4B0_NOTPE